MVAEQKAVSREQECPRPEHAPVAKPDRAGVKSGRPEAAAAVWDWRRAGAWEHATRKRRQARVHGAVQALAAGALGALLFLFWSKVLGRVVWGIAALTLAAALLSPERAYAGLRRVVGLVASGIGVWMSWLLLAPLFYLFFLPFGLLFRRGPADRLERRFKVDAPTYWKRRQVESPSPADYERQF